MMTGIRSREAALLAAAVALLFSCGEKGVAPSDEKPYTLTLHAAFEPLTRAGADAATGSMAWSSGDRIAVGLDDGTFIPFDLVSGAGGPDADFSGTVPAGRGLSGTAWYPYWEGAYSTGERTVTPPLAEDFVSDAYTPAVMSARVDGSSLSFTHAGGIIRFTVKGIPASAVRFTFTSDGGVYGNDSYSVLFPAGGATSRVFSVPVQAGTLAPYTISLSNAADDVLVSKTKGSATEVERCDLRLLTPLEVVFADSFRVVCWNILNGMEADYDNDYDNLVAWVNALSPDVLVLTESKPFNKSSLEKRVATLFAARMKARAARWGHGQVAIVNIDNYPVTITSAHPLTVQSLLTDKDFTSHGAVHVSTGGYEIVGLHLQPTLDTGFDADVTTKYAYYGARRKAEFAYILEETMAACPDRKDWIFAGDFNSYSLKDRGARSPYGGATAYSYPDEDGQVSSAYGVYDAIIGSGLADVLYDFNAGAFQPTMYHGRSRIDYFFATPGVCSRVKRAEVVRGGFPGDYSPDLEQNPSDHFPILMDIADYAFKVLDGYDTLNDWEDGAALEE